jgi:hypothetical protein
MLNQLINILETHKPSRINMTYNITNEVRGAVYFVEEDALYLTDDVEYMVSEGLYDTRGNFKSTFIIYRFEEREDNE